MQSNMLPTLPEQGDNGISLSGLPSVSRSLPRIIWVAARPPVPPFSGITSKTLCGLDALSAMTEVDLITFTDDVPKEILAEALQQYWGDRPISVHILPRQKGLSWHQALLRRRFQLSTVFERGSLAAKLSELEWLSPDRLVIFDDIVLAPVARDYGANAILSPHDCMSRMFYSHYRLQAPSVAKLRKYIQYQIARYYERAFYHSVLLVHVVTHRDRVWLEDINPRARYHVVPNADLLNPGLAKDFNSPWDVLVWGDLSIRACAQGAREFILCAQKDSRLTAAKVILIGKVSREAAVQVLGRDVMTHIAYAPRLEDESGQIRSAKIIVIPDIGGAGIKNRVVNVLSSGLCLACLLPQIEGVEAIADRGAINAVTMEELVTRISWVLETHEYERIATLGQSIYKDCYSLSSNRRLWRQMIERALCIREVV